MKYNQILALLALTFSSLITFAQLQPSTLNCDYYDQIESKMQCGPDAYFQKWGGPMCRKYLHSATDPIKSQLLTTQLKAWFPKVRFCLQNELAQMQDSKSLTCGNLNSQVNRSHIDCYMQTGYCELSTLSKAQLGGLSAKAILQDPELWDPLAIEISKNCAEKKFTSDSPLESDFDVDLFHE
jgi:hypothetical protein